MDSKQGSRKKVLMVPWLAHGHITPFLELAKKLSSKNFHIYFCSTPINLTSIQHRINKNQSLSIELIPFHLPPTAELPPHHHTTNGLPPHLLYTLINAFQMASRSFSDILQTLCPDLVIFDFFEPWAPIIASEHKIPALMFVTSGAAAVSFGLHIPMKPGVPFPFPELIPTLMSFRSALSGKALGIDGGDDRTSILRILKKSCNIFLFNSFKELEGKYLDYIQILIEKKIVPIGPLVKEIDDENKDSEIMQWLDTKDELSTVFVSFGSEGSLSNEDREEMAHGLELSGVNFIWVVRFPVGETTNVEEKLPAEFLDRTRERGLVVGWAPQAQILAHSSTCGFVSHCGWNSTLESLKFGVPLIAMPIRVDQPFNGKLVEDVGVGVEVRRDENGSVNRENIAQVIRKVVKDESGVGLRSKAREFSGIIRKKGEEEIDGLAEELMQLCKEGKMI